MYLFDASSIINLVKKGIVKLFEEGATIDLALYESINVIWKEHILLKKIDEDTACKFITIITRVFDILEILSIKGSEEEIFRTALNEGLNIYDSSYIYTALKNELPLVTDDIKLKTTALKYIRVFSSNEL